MAGALADEFDPYRYTQAAPCISYVQPDDSPLRAALVDFMERVFGRAQLQRLYERIKSERFELEGFFARALDAAGITVEYDRARERLIPRCGPLVFIANHPFGVVDGAILCNLAVRTRGDFRILIHAMLCRDADLAQCFLPVDFEPTRAAMRNNIGTKRTALETLNNGGTLLIYPSGGVSTATRCGFGALRDLPWTTFAAKLVQQSRATVVPVFFHGRNSRLFHVMSHLHSSLRTGLLLHEARRRFGRSVRMEIGAPIEYPDLAHIKCRRALTGHLHHKVWELARPEEA